VDGSLLHLTALSWMPAGIGWIALSAIAVASLRPERTLPWRWLGLFAAARALAAWTNLADSAPGAQGLAAILGPAVGLTSGLALLEFARSGWASHGGVKLPRLILLAPAGIAAAALAAGWSWPMDPGGAWLHVCASACTSALFLRLALRHAGPARTGLRAAGALFALYGIGQGLAGIAPAEGAALLLNQAAALLIPAAILAFLLWEPDAASGRGPAHVRTALLVGAALLTSLVLGLGTTLPARLSAGGSPAGAAIARWIPFAAGLVVGCVYYGLLAAWYSALAWAKRMRRQDADLLGPIVEATRDGLIVVDEAGDVVFRNSRFALMWNVGEGLLEQRDAERLWEGLLEQLADAEGFRALLRKAQGAPGEYRDIVRFKDGHVLQVYSCPMPAEAGAPGRAWSFKDITGLTGAEVERRNQQIRLQREADALARLTRRRLSQSGDLEAALREITKLGADTLAVEFASAWLFDAEGARIYCADAYERSGDRHESGRMQPAEEVPRFLASLEAEGRALAVEEPAEDPRVGDLWERQLSRQSVGALLAAPVRLDGETIGYILCAHQGGSRRWAADEAHFVASLADHAAQAVERDEHRLTEQALQRIQELQQLIIDTAAGAVLVTDARGRITAVNEGFRAATGFVAEELVGRPYGTLQSEECGGDCPLRRTPGEMQRVSRHSCRILDREGRPHAALLNAAPVLDPAGALLGLILSYTDVSEAVHARGQVDALLNELESGREALAASRSRADELAARVDELAGARDELNARVEELAAARDELSREAGRRGEGDPQVEQRLARISQELAEARGAQVAAREALAAARQETASLQVRLDEARLETDALRRELDEAGRDTTSLRDRLGDAGRETALLRGELDEARRREDGGDEAGERLAEALHELAEARQGLAATGEELACVRRELAEVRRELEAALGSGGASAESLASEVDALRRGLDEAQSARDAHERLAGELAREAEVLREAGSRQVQELERGLQDARARLRDARADAKAAAEKVALLLDGQRQAGTELSALRAELDRARRDAQSQSSEADAVAERDQALQAELAALRDQVSAARDELAGAREALAEARGEGTAAAGQLAQAGADLERTRAQVAAAGEEMDALRRDLARAGAVRDELVGRNEAQQARLAALETELREARTAIDRLTRAAVEQADASAKAPARAGPSAEMAPLLRVLPGRGPNRAAERAESQAGGLEAAAPAGRRAFDAQALLERVGGDRQLAAGRARAFQKGSTWMVACLRQALQRKDPRALVGAARSLRSALGDVAAEEAQRLAGELEDMGRRKDLGGAPKMMKALESELERVRCALASYSRAA